MVVQSNIVLPRDQYAHRDATAEWWWHIGTLYCGDRRFGFEVAANCRTDTPSYAFNEIMVSDIAAQRHYQSVTVYGYDPQWAETDQTKPWRVQSGPAGASGAIAMSGPAENSGQMTVTAQFTDADGTPVALSLTLAQQGRPLLVWGTGKREVQPGTDPLKSDNFYYSFTRLAAEGTVTIGGESYPVTGTTWMDHEYGAFPPQTAWLLQNAQLDNGVHLSTYFTLTEAPVAGQPLASQTSVLWPDGNTIFVDSVMAPSEPYQGPQGVTFFLQFDVEIPELNAKLHFESLLPEQIFTTETRPVYEGIAAVSGTFENEAVGGDGWIEQDIPTG